MENTEENNALIAESRGFKFDPLREKSWEDRIGWRYDELKFHTSWDWLMPVVEECLVGEAEQGEHATGLIKQIYEGLNNIDINATHRAVVKFIKWVNDQLPREATIVIHDGMMYNPEKPEDDA